MKKIGLYLCCICIGLLAGCGRNGDNEAKEYTVYYVDNEENKVSGQSVEIEGEDTQEILQALFARLAAQPEDAGYKSAIPENVELESYAYEDYQLILNFSGNYSTMSPTREVLTRAAIVRTLCQVNGVNYVAFNVGGEALVNVSGIPVGYMTADQFVDNEGNEINAYEKVSLTLYYADRSGTNLEAHLVDRVYNSNISMDRLIVEELIAGPEDGDGAENGFATLSPETKIVSVTTRDNTCYVNLDEGFLNLPGNITPEVAIYSIVNSLVELSGVNKVQISVNGSTDLIYMETIPLSQVFERNLEIMRAQ